MRRFSKYTIDKIVLTRSKIIYPEYMIRENILLSCALIPVILIHIDHIFKVSQAHDGASSTRD